MVKNKISEEEKATLQVVLDVADFYSWLNEASDAREHLETFFNYWQQRLKEFETTLDGAPNDQTALEVSSED